MLRYSAFSMLMTVAFLCDLSAQTPEPQVDIRGPKALVEIPVAAKAPVALWASIGGGVVLLAITGMCWKNRVRHLRMKSPPEIALASLNELAANHEAIAAEAFANRAAQTVRQYIAARFGLAAPRRTTEEFLQDLAKEGSGSLIGESDHLRAFLKSCDLAKFAGTHLDSTQRHQLIDAARGFVNSTSKAVTP